MPVTLGAQGETPGPPTHLLYLHGFRSSPRSFKALRLRAWLQARHPAVHWWCPQLPASPRAALALLRAGLASWPATGCAVLGSSLGGFYATVLAEDSARGDWRVVLMNPAVDPARDLAAHVGELTAFHDPAQRFVFSTEHIEQLRALAVRGLTRPQRYLPIIAKGDELLSWREMSARYAGTPMRLIDGSDHGLSDFEDHLPHLLRFLKLCD